MAINELIKLLDSKYYSYTRDDEGDVVVTHNGSVYLGSLTTLPENTKFENHGSVHLGSLTTLPENTKFENHGSVHLGSLTTLPENTKFENHGSVHLGSLTTLPENTKFENHGSVHLGSLTTLPENTKFENHGSVHLGSLTTLPENTKFENHGYVHLGSLTTLPENTKFENHGSVHLGSLTTLPENTKFENHGSVYLGSLDHKSVIYLGKRRTIRHIDGTTMIVTSTKARGSETIMRARYFQGCAFNKMDKCFIAQIGDVYAHGETIEQALRDCRLKALGPVDESLIASTAQEAIERGWIDFAAWHVLSGQACQAGTAHHLGVTTADLPEKMKIKEALTRSASSSHGQTLRRNLERHGYTESVAA